MWERVFLLITDTFGLRFSGLFFLLLAKKTQKHLIIKYLKTQPKATPVEMFSILMTHLQRIFPKNFRANRAKMSTIIPIIFQVFGHPSFRHLFRRHQGCPVGRALPEVSASDSERPHQLGQKHRIFVSRKLLSHLRL